MRAVVEMAHVVPLRLVIAHDFHARAAHLVDVFLLHLVAAEPVEEHAHVDAGPRPFGERVGEFLADIARPVDVGLEVDGALRPADRLEHRGEDLVAVEERIDAVALHERRAEQHAHRAQELRIGDRVLVRDLLRDVARRAAHDDAPDRHRDQRDGRDDDDARERHADAEEVEALREHLRQHDLEAERPHLLPASGCARAHLSAAATGCRFPGRRFRSPSPPSASSGGRPRRPCARARGGRAMCR